MKIINNKRNKMNNFKKIGLSALAGSLVAVSAYAGEMAVTGGLTATYASKDGNSGKGASDHGRGFSTATDITFTGSAELDNGWTVSGFVTQLEGMGAISSSQMTIGMGSLGKLKVNREGGGAVNALDDKLPTAWEEASDNSAHDFLGEDIGSANDDGAITYHFPEMEYEGNSINIGVDYDPASGVKAGGTGSTQLAGSTYGGGRGVAVQIGTAYGFNVYGGADVIERRNTTVNKKDQFNGTVGAAYSYGPVTVGYQEWYNDAGTGDHTTADGMSIAFAVNENLSVSYGEIEETKNRVGGAVAANADLTTDLKAYNVAYSMGAIAIKAHHGKTDNANFGTATSAEMTEISVSFAF
jgi:outer membrane protein OmpU